MSIFLGSDTYCLDDILLIDTQVTDPVVLIGQRLARRLTTQHGALAIINDAPDEGFDVNQLVNQTMTSATIANVQSQIEAECLRDEAVSSVTVTIAPLVGGKVSIKVAAVSSAGPFTFVLNVNQVTTQLIFGNQ